MGTAWVNFFNHQDPNGVDDLPERVLWPRYDSGRNIGTNMVWDLGNVRTEEDSWRQDGMAWFIEYALAIFGN
jgi:hypothetical protein